MNAVWAAWLNLQWSHDFSAMDTKIVVAPSAKPSTLQWSHDFSAMDTMLGLVG